MDCCICKSNAGFSYISVPKGFKNSRLFLARPGTGLSPLLGGVDTLPELELPLLELPLLELPLLELPLPELELPLPE